MSQIGLLRNVVRRRYLFIALFVSAVSAHGQKYEITPLIGGSFGGTIQLEQASTPNVDAHVADGFIFGLAGGFRFDGEEGEGYDAIEFRWFRQDTNLFLTQDPLVATPLITASFRPGIALDHFLGDFTHEFADKRCAEDIPVRHRKLRCSSHVNSRVQCHKIRVWCRNRRQGVSCEALGIPFERGVLTDRDAC